MKAFGLIVMTVLLFGCEDKAKPSYADCVQAEAKGDVLAAEDGCTKAVAADPTSASGKAAAEKLKALQPAVAKIKQQQAEDAAKAKAAAEAAAAAQRAAQAATDAKCKTWVTVCTIGQWKQDNSEATTGLQSFNSRSACEDASKIYSHCDPCRCYD